MMSKAPKCLVCGELDYACACDVETKRATIWRELEWVRFELKRKPGWSAITYKEMFGMWPETWLQTLTPKEPSKEMRRFIVRRDNAYKRERKRAGQTDAAVSRRG